MSDEGASTAAPEVLPDRRRPLPVSLPPSRGITATEVLIGILSLLWIGGLTLVFVFGRSPDAESSGFDPLAFVMTLLAVFLPVAVLWVGAASARSARIMREESDRLHAAIEGIRQSYLADVRGPATRAGFERKLDEIAQAQKKTEAAIATFASIRVTAAAEARRTAALPPPPAPAPALPADQTSLPLGATEVAPQPITTDEFIRALNFPENADDAEGFRALRRALTDRPTAQVIQASQDVLTLLSQDGIYMDDLRPDRAKPDIWRRFAQGERGRTVSSLGGIRDRTSLALAAGRMRTDTIFRDAVHHFLRKFDQMLFSFEKRASDAEIAEMAETRTARAFMLLGRVAGTFD
jgi:hypothetical protein